MEQNVRTSFIPKQAIQVEQRRPRGNPAGLLTIIATLIFIGMVGAAAASFLFQQYTQQSIKSKQDSLSRSRSAFEPAIIKELARLDNRITSAETLLKNHVAVSRLFDYLEKDTLSTVRFNNFSYELAGPGLVTLTMDGTARSYSALALQSDAFGKSDIIKQPIFADLNLDALGNVTFKFSAVVNTAALGYVPGAKGGTASTSAALPTTTTTP